MKIRIVKDRAMVLVTTVVIGGLLGLALGSYLMWAFNHAAMTRRSASWNAAIPVLEAGIEEALSQINYNPNQRASNGWQLVNGLYTKTRDVDAYSYYNVTITTGSLPVIVSQGYVKAPLQANKY